MKEEKNERWICVNCGYIYDPAKGDPFNAVPPGTICEELPEEWVCPMCYSEKEQFDPLD